VNKYKLHYGGYSYSIRTSGEVVGVFIREIDVLYVVVLFIGAKVQLNLERRVVFFAKVKFLTNQ
jgi:hypothetical protein